MDGGLLSYQLQMGQGEKPRCTAFSVLYTQKESPLNL